MVVSIRSRNAHALHSENETGKVNLTSIFFKGTKRSSEPLVRAVYYTTVCSNKSLEEPKCPCGQINYDTLTQ